MKNIGKILSFSLFLSIIGLIAILSACSGQTNSGTTTGGQIIVQGAGGAAKLIAQCGDRSYVAQSADYIIEGAVVKVESRWNEDKTNINTYTNFRIDNYVKGAPFAQNEIQIVTPGGTVGEITQAVEDQAIFHEGARVRIYFEEYNGRYVIVCGPMGVEEM